MTNNPFLSDIFKNTWLNHFNKGNKKFCFSNFKKLRFVKFNNLPLYINVGKTHTKGIFYTVEKENKDIGSNVFLIYDIPQYFNINTTSNNFKTLRCKQYPGFLIHIDQYENLTSYLQSHFKKSSRYKLKKYQKRLELCFNITYKSFYGEIEKKEYDFIFKCFKDLLIKRFEHKQTTNNNLNDEEWNFYFDVAYNLILEKKAQLFVILDNQRPIAITLNYFSDSIIYDAITVFDIDYSKFHLGSVNIMKLIEWGIQENFKILDFSKGYFDYKSRWSNEKYDFEYHIHYNPKSLVANCIAYSLKYFFQLKQFLRENNINDKLHKTIYKLRKKRLPITISNFKLETTTQNFNTNELVSIDLNQPENNFIKPALYEFLYLCTESFNSLKVYRIKSKKNEYLVEGIQNIRVIEFFKTTG